MTNDEVCRVFNIYFKDRETPSFNVTEYSISDGMITLTMCNRKSSFEELNNLKHIQIEGYSKKAEPLYLLHIVLESSDLSRININHRDIWFKISLPIKEIYYT